MAEYIDRIDFINKLEVINGCVDCNEKCRDCGVNDIKGMLRSIPAANVAPVVHGRWVTWEEQFPGFKPHINDKLGVFCSLCHAHSDCISPYCPNCGAKMDIGKEE